MTQRIPVTVFTGFLGAGKTTLLSGLIRDNKQRRLAILVNEFGEVSIDGALLRSDGERGGAEVHDLSNGLIAYDDDADFLPTMQALWQRRGTIDHVLIETSGLALPTAVMESLQSEALAPYFVLDATLAVVDTPLLLSGGFDRAADDDATQTPIASLFEQQLANADIVVLNKIDALGEDAQLDAEARVRALAPSVRFIELHSTPGSTRGSRSACVCTSRPAPRTGTTGRWPPCPGSTCGRWPTSACSTATATAARARTATGWRRTSISTSAIRAGSRSWSAATTRRTPTPCATPSPPSPAANRSCAPRALPAPAPDGC